MKKARPYRVYWEIDIAADTPERAAQVALDIQRDPESTAVIFSVEDYKTWKRTVVDLHEVKRK